MILLHKLYKKILLARKKQKQKANSKGSVSIFSPVKGKLTLKGKPLEGVAVTRSHTFSWRNEDNSETVYSDENGFYSFEEARGNIGIGRFLPHEAVISQTIEAKYRGETFLLWNFCKRDYQLMGEFSSLEKLEKVDTPLLNAYREGYILLNGDLEKREDTAQRIASHEIVFSMCDFQFPFQVAMDRALIELNARQEEFTAEVRKHFSSREDNHETFFECLKAECFDPDDFNEYEAEKYAPYLHCTIQGVNIISFSEHLDLSDFEENYCTDCTEMRVNGEIILDLLNKEGEEMKARIWLHDASFKVTAEKVIFVPDEYSLMPNAANINPDDEA